MIPQYHKIATTTEQAQTWLDFFARFFLVFSFFFFFFCVLPLKKIHVHDQDTAQNYQILAHTAYTYFYCAAADSQIQDTYATILRGTNDVW